MISHRAHQQGRIDRLFKPFLVAGFVDQRMGRDEDDRPAREAQAIDLAQLVSQADHRSQREILVDGADIAKQWQATRFWNFRHDYCVDEETGLDAGPL